MKTILKYNIIILLGVVLLMTTSCKKYLDVIPKGKTLLITFDDYNKVLNYASYHQFNHSDIEYLNDQRALNEGTVSASLKGGAWGSLSIYYLFNESELATRFSLTGAGAYNGMYSNIAAYTMVIDNAGSATTGTDAQKKQIIAEARALRAYNHFLLVNLYAKAYDPATAKTDNAIVIKTDFDLETLLSPSTVQQVYDFIESELLLAIPDLSNNSDNAFHPSKAFGFGLLAKMYLHQGRFDKAEEAANQSLALNKYIFDLVKYYKEGQLDPVDVTMPENSYYAFATTSGYDVPYNFVISREFYNSFDTLDARRNAFFDTAAISVEVRPSDKKKAGTASFAKKISGTSPMRFCYNTAGMKTTDVMLMLAECKARAGNFAEATKLVDEIRAKRIVGYTATPAGSVPTNKKDAVHFVLEERKKELIFGFTRFFDLKRLGREPDYAITVKRVFPYLDETIPVNTYTLNPNSPLYIIPLSKATLSNNPNLKQNAIVVNQ